MKMVEEVAREAVRGGECIDGPHVRDGIEWISLRSLEDADRLRAWLVSVITRCRAEGAAAERERLAAHAGRPAEEVAAEVARSLDGGCAIEDDEMFVTAIWSTAEIDQFRGILARIITRERAAAYVQGKADAETTSLSTADMSPEHVQRLKELRDDLMTWEVVGYTALRRGCFETEDGRICSIEDAHVVQAYAEALSLTDQVREPKIVRVVRRGTQLCTWPVEER